MKAKKPKVEIDQVKPFDYSSVESTLEAKKKNSEHFDPAREAKFSKGKKGGRKKSGGRSDKKSLTYGTKKHQANLSHRSYP